MTRDITYPLGIGLGLLGAILLAPQVEDDVARLAQVRRDRDALVVVAARPTAASVPLVVPEFTGKGGARSMIARIRTLASGGGVLVEDASPLRSPVSGLSVVRLRVSGPEKAVLAMADALEREAPLLRFATWEVVALPAGGMRLQAEVIGPW